MNNAELIVATLRAAGVSHGFGIPSGNVLPLIEAMRVGRLPYVLTAHEGSAAFIADVMGRLTGAGTLHRDAGTRRHEPHDRSRECLPRSLAAPGDHVQSADVAARAAHPDGDRS